MNSVYNNHRSGWVPPFGDLRIKAYSQLPEAYRSVLRPSSSSDAKASTKCPFYTYKKLIIYDAICRTKLAYKFL